MYPTHPGLILSQAGRRYEQLLGFFAKIVGAIDQLDPTIPTLGVVHREAERVDFRYLGREFSLRFGLDVVPAGLLTASIRLMHKAEADDPYTFLISGKLGSGGGLSIGDRQFGDIEYSAGDFFLELLGRGIGAIQVTADK